SALAMRSGSFGRGQSSFGTLTSRTGVAGVLLSSAEDIAPGAAAMPTASNMIDNRIFNLPHARSLSVSNLADKTSERRNIITAEAGGLDDLPLRFFPAPLVAASIP